MQKYGLDIYIQTVRTEYISKSLNRSLRVYVLHSTPSCLYVPPALLFYWNIKCKKKKKEMTKTCRNIVST